VCSHAATAGYCDQGQVRGVELGEGDAMGPMIGRFVASQLWRGENFFMQVRKRLY
jgi:hypothetical protein